MRMPEPAFGSERPWRLSLSDGRMAMASPYKGARQQRLERACCSPVHRLAFIRARTSRRLEERLSRHAARPRCSVVVQDAAACVHPDPRQSSAEVLRARSGADNTLAFPARQLDWRLETRRAHRPCRARLTWTPSGPAGLRQLLQLPTPVARAISPTAHRSTCSLRKQPRCWAVEDAQRYVYGKSTTRKPQRLLAMPRLGFLRHAHRESDQGPSSPLLLDPPLPVNNLAAPRILRLLALAASGGRVAATAPDAAQRK